MKVLRSLRSSLISLLGLGFSLMFGRGEAQDMRLGKREMARQKKFINCSKIHTASTFSTTPVVDTNAPSGDYAVIVDQKLEMEQFATQRFQTIEQTKNAFVGRSQELAFIVVTKHNSHNHQDNTVMTISICCNQGRMLSAGERSSKPICCRFAAIVQCNNVMRRFEVGVKDVRHDHTMILEEVPRFYIIKEIKAMILKDIANFTSGLNSGNSSEFTKFFGSLKSRGFLFDFEQPEIVEGKSKARIIMLFCTKQMGLDMFRLFPEVIIFDTTYKTNVS